MAQKFIKGTEGTQIEKGLIYKHSNYCDGLPFLVAAIYSLDNSVLASVIPLNKDLRFIFPLEYKIQLFTADDTVEAVDVTLDKMANLLRKELTTLDLGGQKPLWESLKIVNKQIEIMNYQYSLTLLKSLLEDEYPVLEKEFKPILEMYGQATRLEQHLNLSSFVPPNTCTNEVLANIKDFIPAYLDCLLVNEKEGAVLFTATVKQIDVFTRISALILVENTRYRILGSIREPADLGRTSQLQKVIGSLNVNVQLEQTLNQICIDIPSNITDQLYTYKSDKFILDIAARASNPLYISRSFSDIALTKYINFVNQEDVQTDPFVLYDSVNGYITVNYRSRKKGTNTLSKVKNSIFDTNEIGLPLPLHEKNKKVYIQIQKANLFHIDFGFCPSEIYTAINISQESETEASRIFTELFNNLSTQIEASQEELESKLELAISNWKKNNPSNDLTYKSSASFKRTKAFGEITSIVRAFFTISDLPDELVLTLTNENIRYELILETENSFVCFESYSSDNRIEPFAWIYRYDVDKDSLKCSSKQIQQLPIDLKDMNILYVKSESSILDIQDKSIFSSPEEKNELLDSLISPEHAESLKSYFYDAKEVKSLKQQMKHSFDLACMYVPGSTVAIFIPTAVIKDENSLGWVEGLFVDNFKFEIVDPDSFLKVRAPIEQYKQLEVQKRTMFIVVKHNDMDFAVIEERSEI